MSTLRKRFDCQAYAYNVFPIKPFQLNDFQLNILHDLIRTIKFYSQCIQKFERKKNEMIPCKPKK